MQESALETHI